MNRLISVLVWLGVGACCCFLSLGSLTRLSRRKSRQVVEFCATRKSKPARLPLPQTFKPSTPRQVKKLAEWLWSLIGLPPVPKAPVGVLMELEVGDGEAEVYT